MVNALLSMKETLGFSDLPFVVVIILTYNNELDTIECIKSANALNYPNHKLLIVDNGSTDSSIKEIEEDRHYSYLLKLSENHGYPGGMNRGILYALQFQPKYIWLLNNDLVLENDSLSHLVNFAEKNADVAFISAQIVPYQEMGCMEVQKGIPLKDADIGGGVMLVRVSALDEIGLMYEPYFGYYEETDWIHFSLKKGWHSALVFDSIVYHKESITFGRKSPVGYYLIARNALIFRKRGRESIFPTLFQLFRRNFLFCIVNGQYPAAIATYVGVVDYFRGVSGKPPDSPLNKIQRNRVFLFMLLRPLCLILLFSINGTAWIIRSIKRMIR